jgi:CRISPR/Cas system CSM-associated protein Csm4 (group 5 of RAMP superfamily)
MDESLAKACKGYSNSRGGLNLSEFREALSKKYPRDKKKISNMSRKELNEWCKSSKKIQKEVKKVDDKYFKTGSPLTEKQKKWCRCIAHTAKQSPKYNPYALCGKTVGKEGNFKCVPYYDFENIPAEEVEALAKLKGKSAKSLKEESAREYKMSPKNQYY